ncbi:MAG: hypothetical protein K1X52_05600 [Pyrinomonadaceae bacterium]|nr:hypothetical protein [Pyrinomonadaceae bacterium]
MKLVDAVREIETLDEDLIIFIKDMADQDSNILLSAGNENGRGAVLFQGVKYHYLIEVFLAREFVQALIEDANRELDYSTIAQRLFDYAVNDA